MKIKKSVLTLALALAVMCGMMLGVKAADTLETISAYLNYGITVKYSGETQELKDANGNQVYPITYNGTTYLPVRAISNILGIEVNWDGATKTVYLGEGFEPTPETPAATSSNSSGIGNPGFGNSTKEVMIPITDPDYDPDKALKQAIEFYNTGILPEGWSISDPI